MDEEEKYKKYIKEHISENYIRLDQCKDRVLYRIHSRNLEYGIYCEEEKGFIGIREKFGYKYLFTEYHWDTGAPYGTVKPQEELFIIPEELVLKESLGTVDSNTNRLIEFDKPIKEGGKGWYFIDTKDSVQDVRPVSVENKDLFYFLTNIQNSNG